MKLLVTKRPYTIAGGASMSKKESAVDLAKFIEKGVRVKLAGGREGVQPHTLDHSTSLSGSCHFLM